MQEHFINDLLIFITVESFTFIITDDLPALQQQQQTAVNLQSK